MLENQPEFPFYTKYSSGGNYNGYLLSYDVKLSLPNYVNIPIFAGLNYEYSYNDRMDIWAEFGLGFNIGVITDILLETSLRYNEGNSLLDYAINHTYEYRTSTELEFAIKSDFTFQLGAGIEISDKISLGFHYYYLGKRVFIGKYVFMDNGEIGIEKYHETSFESNDYIKKSVISIRLGYHF